MVFAPGLKRAETIEEMVTRLSVPEPGGCWLWQGSHNNKGYAKIRSPKVRGSRAARVIYELKNGPITKGMEIDHLCHNRGCVNPDHLEVVTHQENIQRARVHRLETVSTCEKGHLLRVRETGTRFCHECKMEYQREWRAEQREKLGLTPTAPHKGQRKYQCAVCSSPYEILGVSAGRTRYGCRKCRQAYYRARTARLSPAIEE